MHGIDARAEHLGHVRRVGEDERDGAPEGRGQAFEEVESGNAEDDEVEHDDERHASEQVGVPGGERAKGEEDRSAERAERCEQQREHQHADARDDEDLEVQPEPFQDARQRGECDLGIEEGVLHACPAG